MTPDEITDLFTKNWRRLVDYADRHAPGLDVGEDAVQEVLIELLQKPERLDQAHRPLQFVARQIVYHIQERYLPRLPRPDKSKKTGIWRGTSFHEEFNRVPDGMAVAERVPIEHPFEAIEVKVDVEAAISKLTPEEQRIAALLKEGLRATEIARRLGYPKVSGWRKVRQVEARLRELLADYADTGLSSSAGSTSPGTRRTAPKRLAG